MVETRQTSKFENLVKDNKLLVVIVILPFFKHELVRFCRLNKACYEIIENKVNFEVLLETQGIKKKINPFILAAFKSGPFISKLNGLKELAKHLRIKTIIRSKKILGKRINRKWQSKLVFQTFKRWMAKVYNNLKAWASNKFSAKNILVFLIFLNGSRRICRFNSKWGSILQSWKIQQTQLTLHIWLKEEDHKSRSDSLERWKIYLHN